MSMFERGNASWIPAETLIHFDGLKNEYVTSNSFFVLVLSPGFFLVPSGQIASGESYCVIVQDVINEKKARIV